MVQVENLVTKRSAETTGPGQFDISEFSKQVHNALFMHVQMDRGMHEVLTSQTFRVKLALLQTAIDQRGGLQFLSFFIIRAGSSISATCIMST